jgi:hypothetical protein
MEKRETFLCKRSFSDTCKYVRDAFFPKLRKQGVIGPLTDMLPARIEVDERGDFVVRKMLSDRVRLRVEVEEDSHGKVYVVVDSRLRIEGLIASMVILSLLLTCGCGLFLAVPLIYWKISSWRTSHEHAVALLKTDLGLYDLPP